MMSIIAIETLRNAAAVVSAFAGVAAALSAQLQFLMNRRADPATYFGGYPVTADVSPEGMRRDGEQERAANSARSLQSATTTFLVMTPLLGLYAAVPTTLFGDLALLGLAIGIVSNTVTLRTWWIADRRLHARTEYYVMMQRGGKLFRREEQRALFARENPKLVRWLD